METYDRFTSLKNPNRPVIVEAADKDRLGRDIPETYGTKTENQATYETKAQVWSTYPPIL